MAALDLWSGTTYGEPEFFRQIAHRPVVRVSYSGSTGVYAARPSGLGGERSSG